MRIFVMMMFLIGALYAQKVLVLNSNPAIDKYQSAQNGFIKSFKGEYNILDLSSMSQKEVKAYLYDEYPDIIYAIGTKAYSYANMYLPEKTIFFSSIMNYKRLKLSDNRYGVSNELHAGVYLTLIKSIFKNTKRLSMIYSEYTQDLYMNFKKNAALMDIEIIGQKIDETHLVDSSLLKQSDGLIVLPDPELLKDEQSVKKIFNDMKILKKPVFAYHELFLKMRASLVISAHNPTIGRQVATMIESYIQKQPLVAVQLPMGSNVVFNKRIVQLLGLEFNSESLTFVDEVIE